MSAKFKQVIYAGQKLVDESGGGGGTYQERSVTPSEQAQTVEAQDGYDALSKVYVDAISSNYVGSGVARKSSSDIALSGATLTAPAGYYENDATKSLSEQAEATITPTNTDQTAVAANKYTTGAVTVEGIVCANLSPENIVKDVVVKIGTATDDDSVAIVTGTASGGGGDNKTNELIMRTISGSYQNNDITLVGMYAFAEAYNLSAVSFPNVSSVDTHAFRFCSILSEVYMPSCSYLRQNAFFTCGIETASFPLLKRADQAAFANCSKLSYVNLPIISSIGQSCFSGCSQLSEVHIATSESATCYIDTNAFLGCNKLTTFDAPLVSYIGSYAFSGCTTIQSFSFPNVQSIRISAFYKCYNLLSLYLMGSSVPSLHASNAFSSTPIAGFTTSTGGVYGSIFVPASLYNSYSNATNWVYFKDRLVSLTDEQIAAL